MCDSISTPTPVHLMLSTMRFNSSRLRGCFLKSSAQLGTSNSCNLIFRQSIFFVPVMINAPNIFVFLLGQMSEPMHLFDLLVDLLSSEPVHQVRWLQEIAQHVHSRARMGPRYVSLAKRSYRLNAHEATQSPQVYQHAV